ncbi:hypothetical protein Esti_006272 [Eimeria stiedai]
MQQRPGVPLSPGPPEGPVDGGNRTSNAIGRSRTMNFSGLRPRAAVPVAAGTTAPAATDIRQAAGVTPPSAAAALVGSERILNVESSRHKLHHSDAHLPHARGIQQLDDATPQGTSITPPFSADLAASGLDISAASADHGYEDAVSATLHARAAELCRQPEVYAQLFLMLRSSQGQLAAACLQKLPPENYIGIRDASGHTLLHWAALCNERNVMRILLTAGADVNARATESQQTPLMWAVTKDNASAGRLLLEHGAALYEQQPKSNASGALGDPDKEQPQQLRDYDPQRLRQLPLLQDSKGGTCCTLAAQHNAPKCILLLFKLLGPAAFAVPDASGCTPAHWAAYKGHSLVLRLLLYLEVDVTAVDLFGCLPLHRAAEGGRLEAFRALVEEGGLDPNERTTKTRMTSLDMLSSNKTANPELIAYLKLHQQNQSPREGPCHRILTEEDLKVRLAELPTCCTFMLYSASIVSPLIDVSTFHGLQRRMSFETPAIPCSLWSGVDAGSLRTLVRPAVFAGNTGNRSSSGRRCRSLVGWLVCVVMRFGKDWSVYGAAANPRVDLFKPRNTSKKTKRRLVRRRADGSARSSRDSPRDDRRNRHAKVVLQLLGLPTYPHKTLPVRKSLDAPPVHQFA